MNLFESLQMMKESNEEAYRVAFNLKNDNIIHRETVMATSEEEAEDLIMQKYGDKIEGYVHAKSVAFVDKFDKWLQARDSKSDAQRRKELDSQIIT